MMEAIGAHDLTSILRILTWNVYGRARYVNTRVPAIISEIGRANADVVCLQEVAPWMAKRLHRDPTLRRTYRFIASKRLFYLRGALLILSRWPTKGTSYLPFNRGMYGRGALAAKLEVPGFGPLVVATTHLVSFLERKRVRAAQLKKTLQWLAPYDDVILAGDFNFGDGEQPATSVLDPRYRDPWPALHPGQPGFTWNREASWLTRVNSFRGEKSRRLDRILVRSPRLVPTAIELRGTEAITSRRPILHPSDHFALLASLRIAAGPGKPR